MVTPTCLAVLDRRNGTTKSTTPARLAIAQKVVREGFDLVRA